MLNKSEIVLLHWKTHFCDFPCHLHCASDLAVVRLQDPDVIQSACQKGRSTSAHQTSTLHF